VAGAGVSCCDLCAGKVPRLGCWQLTSCWSQRSHFSSEGWCQSQERDTTFFCLRGEFRRFCRMRLTGFLGRRLPGLTASLVFPAAWAAIEYVLSGSPYGSWGLAAYSQYGNLALLQVLSVTGMWGITFLMGWFASVCNWIWEEGLDSRRVRAGAWVFIGTIATVMLLGGARLALNSPSSQTVRVASISRREVGTPLSPAIMGPHVVRQR